jgi:uncharacterized protein YjiS (DUF1127 family)
MATHTAQSLHEVHGIALQYKRSTPGLFTRIGDFVRSLASDIQRRHRLRGDLKHLQSMSDRMLDDIGISRGEIERVVRSGRR